jgi:CRP/FNR family cyclic AMP-dependent transcriptional regulator
MAKAKFDIDAIPAGEDKILRFLNGGVVFIKGGVGEHAYLVKSGKVEIREAGRAVETMEPGELFGQMALIDSELHGSSAVAVGPTELIRIDLDTFHMLVRDVPGFALTIMRLMARRLRAVQGTERPKEDLPIVQKSANSG